MSYYSIGNSNAIGGGSLAKTEKLPSLKLRCLDLCARHLDRLGNLGDMPTEMFIDLLQRAKEKATPEIVQRLQDENERLMCSEVDRSYWKRAVEGHILRRTVPAPGPVLVERVNEYREEISALQETAPSERSSSWARDISAILQALQEIPASVGILKQTMIGKAVGPLRKAADPEVARAAAALVNRWKEAAAISQQLKVREGGSDNNVMAAKQSAGKAGGGSTPSKPKVTGTAVTPGGSSGGCGGAGSGSGGAERNPAQEKQRYVEEGFRCRTWHELYQHLELMREEKVRISSKRAREARELAQQKKPKMIVGKSKGEDLKLREDRKIGRRSAMSMASSWPTSPQASGGRYDPSPTKHSSNSGKRFFAGNGGGGGGGGGSKGATSSVQELRQYVAIGERLSRPMVEPGKRRAGDSGIRSLAKKSKFWK